MDNLEETTEYELTKKEIDIIECFAIGWGQSDGMATYGHLSYRAIYNLCLKLNIEVPQKLMNIIDGTFEKKMIEKTKDWDFLIDDDE